MQSVKVKSSIILQISDGPDKSADTVYRIVLATEQMLNNNLGTVNIMCDGVTYKIGIRFHFDQVVEGDT